MVHHSSKYTNALSYFYHLVLSLIIDDYIKNDDFRSQKSREHFSLSRKCSDLSHAIDMYDSYEESFISEILGLYILIPIS